MAEHKERVRAAEVLEGVFKFLSDLQSELRCYFIISLLFLCKLLIYPYVMNSYVFATNANARFRCQEFSI